MKKDTISWQSEYWENNECLYRDIDYEYDNSPDMIDDSFDYHNLGRYQIIFEYDNQRYYCYIDAFNLNEALGLFFKNHNNVTYDNIVEHLEI